MTIACIAHDPRALRIVVAFRDRSCILERCSKAIARSAGSAEACQLRPPVAVEAVADPSDLLTLPFAALAARVARRGGYLTVADSCYNR
ncbi:MAG: hypothetical protein ABIY55_35490 [Kofleriaceae bacterium]